MFDIQVRMYLAVLLILYCAVEAVYGKQSLLFFAHCSSFEFAVACNLHPF